MQLLVSLQRRFGAYTAGANLEVSTLETREPRDISAAADQQSCLIKDQTSNRPKFKRPKFKNVFLNSADTFSALISAIQPKDYPQKYSKSVYMIFKIVKVCTRKRKNCNPAADQQQFYFFCFVCPK